jgi:peroxiredoxin
VKCAHLGLLSFGLLLSCGAGPARPPEPPPASAPSILLGKPLPDVDRRTLSGEKVATRALLGRKVVVKFFAKYCEPCKRTLPAVEALHQRRPEIAFLGVSEDEGPSSAEDVVRTYHLTFPVILDSGNALSGRFRVTDLPITFVADATGVVRWVGGAGTSEQQLVSAIESLP